MFPSHNLFIGIIRFTLPVLVLLALGIAHTSADTPNTAIADARADAASGDLDTALSTLDEYLNDHPDDVEAQLFRGVVLSRRGDIDQAVASFQELAVQAPGLAEPHNNLAVLYAAQGRFEAARQALLRAVEIDATYDTAHENLGDLYVKLANVGYSRAYESNATNVRAFEKSQALERTPELRSALGIAPPTIPLETRAGSIRTPAKDLETTATTAPAAYEPAGPCYVIAEFANEAETQPVLEWLRKHGTSAALRRRAEQQRVGYRVYLPPLENERAANAKVAALKAQGVTDIMRIPQGELSNGVSLGVYSTSTAAQRRAEEIHGLGYPVQSALLTRTREFWVLLITTVSGLAFDRQLFEDTFPTRVLLETSCD